MRFTIQRSRLAEIVSLAAQAAASKSPKKILESLRIEAKSNEISLAATDLEVAVRYRIPDVDVAAEGAEVVPASLLAGTLGSIADETVTLRSERRKLTVETDGGFFELEGEDPSEFPGIPEFPPESTGSVSAADLRDLVRKTSFAVAREAARYALNGVRVMADEKGLTCVATDGRRLAACRRPFQGGGKSGDVSAIIGVKGLQQFEKAAAEAGEEEGPLDLHVGERAVALRTARATVSVRVMEGVFPDHNEIIPRQCDQTARVPVSMFTSRVRQAAQFASLESQSVILKFSEGEVAVSAAGGQGRAEVRMGVEFEGPEIRIGFNPGFLVDGLKALETEEGTIGLNGGNAAAKITDGESYTYVVMPVILD